MAVSIAIDTDELLDQAEILERRAAELRDQANDLNQQARALRGEWERIHRPALEVFHPEAMKLKSVDRRMASKILRCLEAVGPCPVSVVAEHVGVTGARASAELRRLRDQGAVKQSGMKRGTLWAMPDEDFASLPPDRSDYRFLVRDAARRLGTFTIAEINAELPMIADGTVRRHLHELHADGVLVSERIGKTILYAHTRAEGPSPARPRQATPESQVIRRFQRRGDATSGRRHRTGSSIVNELIREVSPYGVEIRRSSHRIEYWLRGQIVATSSKTPGASSLKQTRSDLRKAGIPV